MSQDWHLLSSYAGLLFLATGAIYCGSFGSLPNPKPAPGEAQEDEDEEEEVSERMSSEDAWLFPVIGSVTLFGLYLVVKYLGPEWINYLLGWYFSLAGVASVWKTATSFARFVVGETQWKKFDKNSLAIKKGGIALFTTSLRTPAVALMPFATIPSLLYSFGSTTARKSALLTDVLAMSFCHSSLSLLKIDSFKTGCILLSGLFFYDIWWVFGTEVMVKVATTLDVPIKLLWPKSYLFSTARGFTMLGLGDIVIPGTFVSLGLRYDYFRHQAAGSTGSSGSFPKPYFKASLVAYTLGLVTTMVVMHSFGKAQPALLYLSPACILSFFATALLRGELSEAWAWSDEPPAAGADADKAKNKSE
ncbi:hypothetical protein HGRIS_002736 [Hohenbuehelia grisea]|uniref:Peptidase A22B, signal peptide peptidase n=1 Tax=Hohenbuehelia grisea TaxID=104357 RepID=A0ABR3JLC2_9AGAR